MILSTVENVQNHLPTHFVLIMASWKNTSDYAMTLHLFS